MRDLLTQDQRLVILRALVEMPGYEANESILHTVVGEFGHSISRDTVRAHLAWLDEQGLVSLREVAGIRIARLSERGGDVAAGRAHVPGVKKPSPR